MVLCKASDGYYAVSQIHLQGFLDGELHTDIPGIDHIGAGEPAPFRYPQAGKLHDYEAVPEWYANLIPKLVGG